MSSKYSELQCPLNWEEICNSFEDKDWVACLSTKLKRPFSCEWKTYCNKLLLGCALGKENREEEALDEFQSCMDFVDENSQTMFFMDIVPGMKYMVNASKCILYFTNGKRSLAMDMVSSMESFKDLNNQSQGYIWAAKSRILMMFGYVQMVKALDYAKLAIELDPDEGGHRRGAWFYLAGNIMGKIRRTKSGNVIPSSEELKYLEKSVGLNPFPDHYAVLAEVYRESGKVLWKQKNSRMCSEFKKESKKKVRKALEMPNLSCLVLRRCGATLLKMPAYKDIKLIEEILKRASEIEPSNAKVYLYLGNLEYWKKNNKKAAVDYYEKAYLHGCKICGTKIITLRYMLDNSYDPLEDCDMYITDSYETLPHEEAQSLCISYLAMKGEFYLNVRNDFVAAAREWEMAFEINRESRSLKEYYSTFPVTGSVNLFEVLKKGITKAIGSANLKTADTEYLLGLLEKYY